MPHKDREARNAYQRARHAKLLEENPDWVAKRAAQQAKLHAKKMKEDEAYRAKRKENYDRWHALYGKESARKHNGYRPLEEYLAECEEKRRKSASYMREWNKTEAGHRSKTAQSIKKRCGLSIEEYDAAYIAQEGKCRICGEQKERYGRNRLVVDHCHETGKFRSLLCCRCNSAIGLFGESEEKMHSAIRYLQEITGG